MNSKKSHPKTKFRISNLVEEDRVFRISTIALSLIVIAVIGFILRSFLFPRQDNKAQVPQSPSETIMPPTREPLPSATTIEPTPERLTPTPYSSAISQALLSGKELNYIVDIWSPETSEINIHPLSEYHLSEAAGRSYRSRSGEINITLEAYYFSDDPRMAFNVAAALEELYRHDLGYTDTYMACAPSTVDDSWILEDKNTSRIYLVKTVPSNIIGIGMTNEGLFDKKNLIKIMCSIAEKQIEALKEAGY